MSVASVSCDSQCPPGERAHEERKLIDALVGEYVKLCKDRFFNCMGLTEFREFVEEKHALAFDLWYIREGNAPRDVARLEAERYPVLLWRHFQNHVHTHAHLQSSAVRGPLILHIYAWLMGTRLACQATLRWSPWTVLTRCWLTWAWLKVNNWFSASSSLSGHLWSSTRPSDLVHVNPSRNTHGQKHAKGIDM